jgi:hypothetical protein
MVQRVINANPFNQWISPSSLTFFNHRIAFIFIYHLYTGHKGPSLSMTVVSDASFFLFLLFDPLMFVPTVYEYDGWQAQ